MPTLRRDTLAQVDKALTDKQDSGVPLSMALWRDLVQHPADPGILPEGFEYEGELLPGENPWIDAGDHIQSYRDRQQEHAIDASIDPVAACADLEEEMQEASHIIAAVEAEEPAVVEEAKCERLRALAVKLKLPQATREANLKKNLLLKKKNPKSTPKVTLRARLLLQRSLRARMEEESAKADKKREEALKQKALKAQLKAAALESKAVADLASEKKKSLPQSSRSCLRSFRPKTAAKKSKMVAPRHTRPIARTCWKE